MTTDPAEAPKPVEEASNSAPAEAPVSVTNGAPASNPDGVVPADPTPVETAGSSGVAPEPGVGVSENPPVNSGYVSEDTETLHDVSAEDSESLAYNGSEAKDVEVAFTYETHLDPRRQADPNGIYLDDIERQRAEIIRARIEDRKPDLDNPPPIASTPYIPTVQAQHLAPTGAVVPVAGYETVNVGGGSSDTDASVTTDDGLSEAK